MRLILLVMGVALVAGARPAFPQEPKPTTPAAESPIVVDLTLKGTIEERPSPLNLDGAPLREDLRGLVEKLAKAKADPKVKGIVLRLKSPTLGLAKAHELRRAIAQFRSGGKKVFAFLEDGGNADYLIASAADEVVMPESGTLMLKGFAAEVVFYKGLFDKVGIAADFLQVGEYKGTGEVYTRTAMSPEFREELAAVLGDDLLFLAEAIAHRLGVPVDDAKALIDDGPYAAGRAKSVGLLTRVAYEDGLKAMVGRELGLSSIDFEKEYGSAKRKDDLSGFAGFMRMMQAMSGESARKPASKVPKVALIHASGTIMTGKSSPASLLGEAVLGSDSLIKDLRKAEEDETVRAIVLRVDSPGGSALASDLIWREVVRIKAKKPIVASMSDVAASGGYYISMGCDKVYAGPCTLTGSIGVVGGKLAVQGLLEKVGLSVDSVAIGKNAQLMSIFKPFSVEERAIFRRMMEDIYEQFTAKAAQGRKMEREKLLKLAGGRVYSGRKAKELGLVDEVGTLNDAIQAARDLAKVPPGEATEVLVLPEPLGVLEALIGSLEDAGLSAPRLEWPLPDAVRQVLGRATVVQRLLERERVLLIAPYAVIR